MLFYLYESPPEFILDLDSVETLILERFQLYSVNAALQYDTEEFNYYDRISHLLMSIIANDCSYFKDAFIKGEIKIFKEKFQNIKIFDLQEELSEVSVYLASILQSEEYRILKSVISNQFQLMQNIIEAILSKSSHAFKKNHSKNCRKYKLTLPFTSLLKLVAKREVEVKNGKVSLTCGLWSEILEVLFEFLLRIELKLIENSESLRENIFKSEDDRIRQIIKRFTNVLNGSLEEGKRVVNGGEIDEVSRYFPPCMANLHQILRQTHRLSYDSRYQYTLFLRDIGLSIDDNLLFWESEYSKPCHNSGCIHNWKENEKRYKYQIEHLYGLIGSPGLKTSHSCEKFVQKLSAKMDGGCPFQHLTPEELESALPKSIMALPDVEDIFSYKNSCMPKKACAVYLSCLQKMSNLSFSGAELNLKSVNFQINKWFSIVSPLQFYNIAKNF